MTEAIVITEIDRGLFCMKDVGAKAAPVAEADDSEAPTVTVDVWGEPWVVGVAEVAASWGDGVGVLVSEVLETVELEVEELVDELVDDGVALDVALEEDELSMLVHRYQVRSGECITSKSWSWTSWTR